MPFSSELILTLSSTTVAWLLDIVDFYSNDQKAHFFLQQFSLNPNSRKKGFFFLQNGLLKYKGSLWVGNNPDLHMQIFKAFHDNPLGGHSGFLVTYRRVHYLFCWTCMKTFIRDMVKCCITCQQAKPEWLQWILLLVPFEICPLLVPTQAWEMITMDFISGLPASGHSNCILVVIDKLTKYGQFIPLRHPFIAQKVA